MKEDDSMNNAKVPNRLSKEKSPYLLQHAHNPVDWYSWSNEAFEKAKKEDKPIFLSIGYSTCHWCHVMEKESFEDEDVAELLNENFISIKVDREERPDVDHIYMSICQALTGSGGWPLTIIMTPEKKPFFAGTYFPKYNRYGHSGLMNILKMFKSTWLDNRDELVQLGNEITDIAKRPMVISVKGNINESIFEEAYTDFKNIFDKVYGGFGSSPKFPTPHNLMFLLRYWHATGEEYSLQMVEKTLDSMSRGGIFDHIGFGFSRYSTDKKWLVPHFEKMLYDNALLAIVYLETYQATGKDEYAQVARDIFTYILRDMTSPQGAFYSAEDADSEGEEGKFYVWDQREVTELLGDVDGKNLCIQFDITKRGNFEGKSIPNLIDKPRIKMDEKVRKSLFEYRNRRVHPYKDDKILTSWNGLMIAAMAIGSRITQDKSYIEAAEKSLEFIWSNLRNKEGRLLARYRDGDAAYPAYVDDYAFLIWGLIELYEATFKSEYLSKALDLNNDLIKYFWDEQSGGLFVYGQDSEELIVRPKEIYDGATPSGNAVATLNWLRLARLTGNHELDHKVAEQFDQFGDNIRSSPMGHTFSIMTYLSLTEPAKEVIIVGDMKDENTRKMIDTLQSKFSPNTVIMVKQENDNELIKLAPFIAEHKNINNKATAYVCENFACQAPITDYNELL